MLGCVQVLRVAGFAAGGDLAPIAAIGGAIIIRGAFGARVVPLGVDEFGQSGTRADLYQYYGIDSESIVSAALLALDLT